MTLTASPVIETALSPGLVAPTAVLTAVVPAVAAVPPTVLPVGLKGAVSGRSVAMWQAYQEHKKTTGAACGFCGTTVNEVVEEHGTMRVIVNLFPYTAWDGMHVTEHLMVVPARHVLGKAEFTAAEAADWWTVVAEYEGRGYSVYTRAPGNASRSMAHLHTHLIATEGWFTG